MQLCNVQWAQQLCQSPTTPLSACARDGMRAPLDGTLGHRTAPLRSTTWRRHSNPSCNQRLLTCGISGSCCCCSSSWSFSFSCSSSPSLSSSSSWPSCSPCRQAREVGAAAFDVHKFTVCMFCGGPKFHTAPREGSAGLEQAGMGGGGGAAEGLAGAGGACTVLRLAQGRRLHRRRTTHIDLR